MKNNIKDYFYFTKSERNSAIWIASIAMIIFILPQSYHYFFPPKVSFGYSEQNITIDENANQRASHSTLFEFDPNTATPAEFSQLGLREKTIKIILNYRNKGGKFRTPQDFKKIWGLLASEYERLKQYIIINSSPKTPINRDLTAEKIGHFSFDPNTASQDSLVKVGIPAKISRQIINYRLKGGKFKSREDLKKIYQFPKVLYDELEPYISIKVPAVNKKNDNTYSWKSQIYEGTIDVNSATYEEWLELPGVGSATASKITRFREKLGGFISLDQIGETYGLQDSVFQKIKGHLIIKERIRRIHINSVSVDALAAHPYCRYYFAKLIINYRDMHKGIKNEAEMQKIYGIKEILPKLLPYLNFSP